MAAYLPPLAWQISYSERHQRIRLDLQSRTGHLPVVDIIKPYRVHPAISYSALASFVSLSVSNVSSCSVCFLNVVHRTVSRTTVLYARLNLNDKNHSNDHV